MTDNTKVKGEKAKPNLCCATDEELVSELFNRVNNISCSLAETISKRLRYEHRTIKQCWLGIMKKVIEDYSAHCYSGYDLRNEASAKWAEKVTKLDPDRLGFPFV